MSAGGECCGTDVCEIKQPSEYFIDQNTGKDGLQGLTEEARRKLLRWADLDPEDYDAPGYSARESGV